VYNQQAAEKFGLNKGWRHIGNPYTNGPQDPPRVPAARPPTPGQGSLARPAGPPTPAEVANTQPYPAGHPNAPPQASPPKAPSVPPKSSTAGGKEEPKSAPPAPPKPPPTGGNVGPKTGPSSGKSVATQFTDAGKKLGPLKNLGSKIAQGLKTVLRLQGLLSLAQQVLGALDMIDNVQSALKGGGFIFQEQVAQANDLAEQVKALVNGYRDAGYHKDLDRMFILAREIDQENPEALYGSDALSTFCASVDDDVEPHERECKELLDEINAISQRTAAGQEAAQNLLNNTAFMTAATVAKTGAGALLFMAVQDFRKINDALPSWQLTEHLTIVQSDLTRIKASILNDLPGTITDE
jgi:hypothetical protein